MIWLVFALMTGAAVLCALWPLARRRTSSEGEARAVAFYKAQIAEIDRDVERGQLPEEEARSARIEAARRLIAAGERAEVAGAPAGARVRRIAASLVILIGVPVVALDFYARYGSPNEPDEPIAARLNDPSRRPICAWGASTTRSEPIAKLCACSATIPTCAPITARPRSPRRAASSPTRPAPRSSRRSTKILLRARRATISRSPPNRTATGRAPSICTKSCSPGRRPTRPGRRR